MDNDKSFFDIVTDEMKEALGSLRVETRMMFAGKQPYRTRKVSDAERIANYLTMPEEVKMKLQVDFPDQYPVYQEKMEDMARRYSDGQV